VITEAFGGRVGRASRPMHGKVSLMVHDGTGLLAGLPDPLEVGRYHSLAAEAGSLPDCLLVQGRTADGEVMALRHRVHDCHGVQFHPESILTPEGGRILAAFVGRCRSEVSRCS